MPLQVIIKFGEDLINNNGTIPRTTFAPLQLVYEKTFDPQGQETPKWIVWSGRNSNSSEILWLPLLNTYKYEEYPIKMKSLSIGQHFHQNKYMEANFRHSRASNTKVLAVLAICKFDENPIKMEDTIDRTRSHMGLFGSQGQVTSMWEVWSGQNLNSCENLWLSW